ncbi:META domain-containing protein [Hymenobacter sp. NST-14]|uniref:META domain-containing protein n=1 Tax=Hymenobacter piscis TaxID=2839984 RepID=UPI001C0141DA|nr:META domain-containing protein [Hymenobacter piscis]MBT9392779.1 META domain-containing protein [Hymenobacter piscis]
MTFSFRIYPALMLGLLATAACNQEMNKQPAAADASATPAVAPATMPLQGLRWELRELAGEPAPQTEKMPFLLLQNDRAEGEAACNGFAGPFELGAGRQLRLGPLMSTRMACPDLAVETRFMQALRDTRHYRISANMLSLFGADTLGTPLARLATVGGK